MLQLRIHGPNKVSLDDLPMPALGPRDALLRVQACGICGSDLGYIAYGGVAGPRPEPTPLGLMALAALRWRGFDDVAIVDLSERRLAIARELGASLALNAGAGDVWGPIHELHGTEKWLGMVPCAGTHAYIEASGAPSVIG